HAHPAKARCLLLFGRAPCLQERREPGGGLLPRRGASGPALLWRVIVLRGQGAVVPPAAVPEALKESFRMAYQEMDVGADGFFQQPQESLARPAGGHGGNGGSQVGGQVKRQAGLGFRFEEPMIDEQPFQLVPALQGQQMPRQVTQKVLGKERRLSVLSP